MGIRFERDSRKATNGPMIFFSILRDETFVEEIRNAFISGLSFYAYRFPHDTMMSYGSSEGYIEGIGTPGFAIGMFDPDKPYITIPYSGIKNTTSSGSIYKMPHESTSFEEYSHEVTDIIEKLKVDPGSKVVAARVLVRKKNFDIAEKFYDLCTNYPEAFVFCFSTPATGCWLGATPEKLLEGKEGNLYTMALAGTRLISADNSSLEWDSKNVEEQKIVERYILDVLKTNSLKPETDKTFSKAAGKIEHICTPISARIPQNFDLEKLLRDLSPTPALCGYPKNFALKEIKELEGFDRGCYGGFCGPFHSVNDFNFNVTLRCGAITMNNYCIYVGGGITAWSSVITEWEETNLKIPF